MYDLLYIVRMSLLKAALAVVCAVSLLLPQIVLADEGSESPDLTRKFERHVFSRVGQLGACDDMTIPFQHPGRPTIYLEAAGVTLPMLFDTGTFTSIFIDDGAYLDPGLQPIPDAATIALLEGKATNSAEGSQLSYASVAVVKLGGVRLRNVPFRVYSSASTGGPRDYAGAIAPMLFRNFMIEVDNHSSMITLHDPANWEPPAKSAVVPLLTLPRGSFVPLSIGGQPLWFHLDTGFSGTIGILPSTIEEHPDWFTKGEGKSSTFSGWDAPVTCLPLVIRDLAIEPYGTYSWATQLELRLDDVAALEYPGDYRDVSGIDVAGIIGSGFLAAFNYALDFAGARMYLWQE